MAPKPDALDKLLAAISKEYELQITKITRIKDQLQQIVTDSEARVTRLSERIQDLVMEARDDNGDSINPAIDEAVDYLESEGVMDMEDVAGTLTYLDHDLQQREEKRDNLEGIIAITPTDSFYLDREVEDGD